MTRKKTFKWLISPKSFIELIGAEYEILKSSGSSSLLKFYVAAVTIMAILIISALSIFYSMELLFHLLLVEMLLSIFISVLFVFIYIFLLNTFSKNIFSTETAIPKPWYNKIKLADCIRVGFVIFMAFIISKPIEVFIFKKELSQKVAVNKEKILYAYTNKIETLSSKEVQKIQRSLSFYKKQQKNHSSAILDNEVAKLEGELKVIADKQMFNINQANKRIQLSEFLLYRIKVVSKNPVAWAICVGIACLFLLPGFLIYSISVNDEYYKLKKESEVKLVREKYAAFEKHYADIFMDTYGINLVYYSKFLDPPFNTIRKSTPAFKSQANFLKNYTAD